MRNNSSKKGFTLIELLIVITIIGILAVALLPSVLGAPARARDAARKADMNNLILALEAFNSDNQHYPSGKGCIETLDDGGDQGILNPYFQGGRPPKDPQANHGVLECATGYVYCPLTGNSTSYMVAAQMEIAGDANAKPGDFNAGNSCPSDPPATLNKPTSNDPAPYLFVVIK